MGRELDQGVDMVAPAGTSMGRELDQGTDMVAPAGTSTALVRGRAVVSMVVPGQVITSMGVRVAVETMGAQVKSTVHQGVTSGPVEVMARGANREATMGALATSTAVQVEIMAVLGVTMGAQVKSTVHQGVTSGPVEVMARGANREATMGALATSTAVLGVTMGAQAISMAVRGGMARVAEVTGPPSKGSTTINTGTTMITEGDRIIMDRAVAMEDRVVAMAAIAAAVID